MNFLRTIALTNLWFWILVKYADLPVQITKDEPLVANATRGPSFVIFTGKSAYSTQIQNHALFNA